MSRLPRAVSSFGGVGLVCPWCREPIEDAVVRLGDLVEGWEAESPGWPARGGGGVATTPLVADCPVCASPSMVAIVGNSDALNEVRFIKLVAVRTAADARLIGDEP